MFDFKKKFDKVKKKGKGKVAKGFFGLTFDGVKNNKDNIKKKNLILKKERKGDNNPLKVYNLRETYL